MILIGGTCCTCCFFGLIDDIDGPVLVVPVWFLARSGPVLVVPVWFWLTLCPLMILMVQFESLISMAHVVPVLCWRSR